MSHKSKKTLNFNSRLGGKFQGDEYLKKNLSSSCRYSKNTTDIDVTKTTDINAY